MGNSNEKTTFGQGLISTVVVCALVLVGYTAWVLWQGAAGETRHLALESPWLLTPAVLADPITTAANFRATLAATLVIAMHIVGAGVAAALLTALLYFTVDECRRHFDARSRRSLANPDSPAYLKPPRPWIEPVIRTQKGTVVRDITPMAQVRLDRASIQTNGNARTPLQQLEIALMQILAAHREWPADPSGHHANTNLHQHSLNVRRALRERAGKSQTTGLLQFTGPLGLAHDIGKILAYKKIENPGTRTAARRWLPAWIQRWVPRRAQPIKRKWVIQSKKHDRLSAFIVSMMPEFQRLPSGQRQTLLTVLAYTHDVGSIPRQYTTDREMALIHMLREVDGLATRDEKAHAPPPEQDTGIVEAVNNALDYIIPQLNINRYQGGLADGWTNAAIDYVAIQESKVREKLEAFVDGDQYQALSLGMKARRSGHPATEVLRKALYERQWLIEEYEGYSPPSTLFSLKVGIRTFDNNLLLDRDALEAAYPDVVDQWGDNEYVIKIIKSREARNPATEDA